ncbi:MAG: valine--tRNA ligase [Myxococcota bacterium]|nr:valine--tRNA ligase [Myxococcota bacterium]
MDSATEIPKHYEAEEARKKYYPRWESEGYFKGDPNKPGKPFSIVIPPPNVTGSLHMGHALNNTLQDILIRYHRMDGDNTVWIPGTDHASIAVHWVLERKFREEGTNRFELGREEFLKRAWAFKEEAESNILNQLRTLGVSCDWSRQRFTMDEGLSAAVREVFVRLYNEGLIYRAERLVNWDVVAQTTLSDLEVVHDEGVEGELWSFSYPLADGSGEIVVATTRPETMLGDTAVAVHPEDPRYKDLIGRMIKHPITGREFPIIADAILVDPEFGTGAVKVTPGHDPNDFEVGLRHKLPMINLLNKDGTFNEHGGPFKDMDRFEVRKAVKAKIDELGLDRGTEKHTMNVGRSERSGTVVEPMLSTQWFVRAKPLAAPSLAAVENGFTNFVPKNWENTYYSWLRDIRDWCISRQLWWGHQIPAWHCDDCHEITVAKDAPDECESCGSKALTQDEDILDTWFSSALWPFSTMGWPEKTDELAAWYPTATLTTGFDIIFFWVARMMMFGQYFMGHVPFKDVYIHALIRDKNGDKMSKTKGNVIDPIDMINQYGCDAFRFTLAAFAAQGRDVRWDESRAEGYAKFVNKIWQAFRFTMGNIDTEKPLPTTESYGVYDRWIRHQLRETTAKLRESLESYRFNDAASCLYQFIWDELCDWYLELSKPILYAKEEGYEEQKEAVQKTLLDVFNTLARAMHPIMPFFTEELWQRLPNASGSIMDASFPKADDYQADQQVADEVHFLKDVIVGIRRVRSEFQVAPKQEIAILIRTDADRLAWLNTHSKALFSLAKATFTALEGDAPDKVATQVVDGAEIFIPLAGLIDFDAERDRLTKDLAKIDKDIGGLDKQLSNTKFISRAPEAVVQEKQALLAAATEKKTNLQAALERLA